VTWLFLALALPILQYGPSWWVNAASFGTFAGIIRLRKLPGIITGQSHILIVAIAGMFIAYVAQSFGDTHSFLRVGREALILILMSFVTNRKHLVPDSRILRSYASILFLISFLQLILTLVQFILLQSGSWFGPPASWFAGRGSLIPTNLDLAYSYIRPSGTFSEPSYLGIICLAIIVVTIPRINKEKIFRAIFFINAITILLSQSKSAILFLVIILIHIYVTHRKYLAQRLPVYFIIGFGFFVIVYSQIISKIQSFTSGEISINNRIFSPVRFLFNSLIDYPLGTEFYGRITTILDPNTGLTWETILHNSIYNLIFSYGFFGIPILIVISRFFRNDTVLQVFLFALLLQNGSFLDFDKLFLVLVTIVIYRQVQNATEKQII
jgi:hypothetical protein